VTVWPVAGPIDMGAQPNTITPTQVVTLSLNTKMNVGHIRVQELHKTISAKFHRLEFNFFLFPVTHS